MEKKNKNNIRIDFSDIALIALLLFVVAYEAIGIHITDNLTLRPVSDMIVTRFAAGIFFLIIVIRKKYKIYGIRRPSPLKRIISILPCLVLVINNMPVLSMLKGDAYITHSAGYVLVFALQCIAVGFFEEIAFRGLFFLMLLQKKELSRSKVFMTLVLTSIAFGMYHLFNLFEGAGLGAVIMQVGYSSLIGAMCAMVLLRTGNIFICIFLHAVYDFCGCLVPTLGGGSWWDTPTVVFTVILSVTVFIYMLIMFLHYDIMEIREFFDKVP